MADDSTRDQLETELRALRAEIHRVCHEIQNPVAVIAGNVELLLEVARGTTLPDEVRLPITDMAEANQLLSERVDQLRALSEG